MRLNSKIKILILTLTAVLSGSVIFLPTKASAVPPKCHQPFAGLGGGPVSNEDFVGSCFNDDGRQFFPLRGGGQIPSDTPESKCYDLTRQAPLEYFEVSCNDSPFTLHHSVRCEDGTTHSAPATISYEEMCAEHGGYVPGPSGPHQCGKDLPNTDKDESVKTSIDLGCKGQTATGAMVNPIIDMLFAFLRFISYGVGLILVGAMIVTGIQYTVSRGNPEATKQMVERLLNIAVGLLIYVFAFAILNYLVPNQLLS